MTDQAKPERGLIVRKADLEKVLNLLLGYHAMLAETLVQSMLEKAQECDLDVTKALDILLHDSPSTHAQIKQATVMLDDIADALYDAMVVQSGLDADGSRSVCETCGRPANYDSEIHLCPACKEAP